jgi:hypothetical protein
VLADWRHSVNRAFKAVKRVPLTGRDNFEALVVIVAANFTFSHLIKSSLLNSRDDPATGPASTPSTICLICRRSLPTARLQPRGGSLAVKLTT